MQPTWTEAELAYFAGILDGEGCLSIDNQSIRVARGRRQYGHPRIRVGNTDARLIQWIQTHFPARVSPKRKRQGVNHKPSWTWELFGTGVEAVLIAVLPYLVIKREQAQLLIEYRRTMLPRGAQRGWKKNAQTLSQETLARRTELHARVAVLNQRGVAS